MNVGAGTSEVKLEGKAERNFSGEALRQLTADMHLLEAEEGTKCGELRQLSSLYTRDTKECFGTPIYS